MNKTELIDAVASRTGESKSACGDIIDGMFVEISNAVANGGKVTIQGMVSFEQVDRAARKGFNPQTGEPLSIPASKAVKVTALSKLKAYAKGDQTPPR